MAVRKITIGVALTIVAALGVAGNVVAAPETDTIDATMETAAREFRIQVYRAFHHDRAEFDRRRDVWSDVQAAWREAGADLERRALLIDWLRAATVASHVESVGPLPPVPNFARVSVAVSPRVTITEPATSQAAPVTTNHDENTAAADDAAAPVAVEASSARRADGINLAELSAGIAGHNFGLMALESDLLADQVSDVAGLQSAVARLESLVIRRGDLTLYYDLLPDDTRSRLEPLVTPADVIGVLGNRISDLRAALEVGPAPAERDAMLEALEELSLRIAEIYNLSRDN